jgi:hypothetical protein
VAGTNRQPTAAGATGRQIFMGRAAGRGVRLVRAIRMRGSIAKGPARRPSSASLAEAEIASAPMPLVDALRDRLITGIAPSYADLDWSALGLIAAQEGHGAAR